MIRDLLRSSDRNVDSGTLLIFKNNLLFLIKTKINCQNFHSWTPTHTIFSTQFLYNSDFLSFRDLMMLNLRLITPFLQAKKHHWRIIA